MQKLNKRFREILSWKSITKSTSKVSQLKEKIEAMTQEQQLIKASYLSIIEGKEKEIWPVGGHILIIPLQKWERV